jgi:hypothetical protein
MLVPETTRLDLTDGAWVVIKKRLTAGESHKIYDRVNPIVHDDGRLDYSRVRLREETLIEYLLDWSLTTPEGKPVVIADQSPDLIRDVLGRLDPESYQELQDAVEAHIARVRQELDAQKKMAAEAVSVPTFESVS